MSNYFDCPICGARVSIKAKACPECGSDEETGWSEAAQYIHLVPDNSDSYDLTNESGKPKSWFKRWGILVTLVMVTAFITVSFGPNFVIVALVAICIIYFVTEIYPETTYAKEKRLHQKLLQKARGNSQLVDRLIELERKRTVKGTRLELLQDALYRWERENK